MKSVSRITLWGLVAFSVAVLSGASDSPKPKLQEFRAEVEPVLKRACVGCHGPEKQKGKFRVDTLNPDLVHGEDVNWWLEVFDVISNAEMPPEDAGVQLEDKERATVVDWLSGEIQQASRVARCAKGRSSFRRLTRYEYDYALQSYWASNTPLLNVCHRRQHPKMVSRIVLSFCRCHPCSFRLTGRSG